MQIYRCFSKQDHMVKVTECEETQAIGLVYDWLTSVYVATRESQRTSMLRASICYRSLLLSQGFSS